jgi:hypothetical protein
MAEIRISLGFTVTTRKFGALKFIPFGRKQLTSLKISELNKLSDRDFFINLISHHLSDPNTSRVDLELLSPRTLKRIGNEFLSHCQLAPRYAELINSKKGIFRKCRLIAQRMFEESEKNQKQHKKPLSAALAYLNSPMYKSAADELNRYRNRINDLIGSGAYDLMNAELKVIEEYRKAAQVNKVSESMLATQKMSDELMSHHNRIKDSFGTGIYERMEADRKMIEQLSKPSHLNWISESMKASEKMAELFSINNAIEKISLPLSMAKTMETEISKMATIAQSREREYAGLNLASIAEINNKIMVDINKLNQGLSIEALGYKKDFIDSLDFSHAMNVSIAYADEILSGLDDEDELNQEMTPIVEYLKSLKGKFPQLTEEDICSCSLSLLNCILMSTLISTGINNRTMTPETGALMVMIIYFNLLSVIFKIINKYKKNGDS